MIGLALAGTGAAITGIAPYVRDCQFLEPLPDIDNGKGWCAYIDRLMSSEEATTAGRAIDQLDRLIELFAKETSSCGVFSLDLERSRAASAMAGFEDQTPREMVFELRKLLGYSWEDLATLLGVDRRTLHNWAMGEHLHKKNRDRLSETLKTVRYIDRGSADRNRAFLNGATPLGLFAELIMAGSYDDVRRLAGKGFERAAVQGTPMSAEWMALHGPRSLETAPIKFDSDASPMKRAPARGKARRQNRRK